MCLGTKAAFCVVDDFVPKNTRRCLDTGIDRSEGHITRGVETCPHTLVFTSPLKL